MAGIGLTVMNPLLAFSSPGKSGMKFGLVTLRYTVVMTISTDLISGLEIDRLFNQKNSSGLCPGVCE